MRIRALRPNDDRAAFTCGNIELDRFFQKFAGQNQFKHFIGATYVAVENDEILGFATVSPTELLAASLPRALAKRLPAHPLPALRLARLGVSSDHQRQSIGAQLLRFALTLTLKTSENLGCVGLVVDAKPEAASFYSKFGFFTLDLEAGELGSRPAPVLMFLSIRDIKAAVGTHATSTV